MRMGLDLSISHVRIDRAVEICDKTLEEMAAIGRRKKRTASTKAGSQKVSDSWIFPRNANVRRARRTRLNQPDLRQRAPLPHGRSARKFMAMPFHGQKQRRYRRSFGNGKRRDGLPRQIGQLRHGRDGHRHAIAAVILTRRISRSFRQRFAVDLLIQRL